MIYFTLFLIGTFPIDSNHSSSQRARLRETTKVRGYAALHRDAHMYALPKIYKHPGEHTLSADQSSGTRSQRCLDVHRNKPAFVCLDHMDAQFQTQAHSHAQTLMNTSHSGQRNT